MKQLTVFVCFLLLLGPLAAQPSEMALELRRDDYLTKSKNQRTAASVLGVAGSVGIIAGLVTGFNHFTYSLSLIGSSQTTDRHNSGLGLFVAGSVVTAASLTLFIASSINRRKANRIDLSSSFKMEAAPSLPVAAKTADRFPALALTLRL